MNTQNINNSNNESINGMSQVINILTGETMKIRCHYLSKRTDKPVSRVLTLERLNHPALTAAGVTAWAERFNDGVNRFDWIRVSIQLTDNLCYTPNCANHDLPSIEHYNDYDDVNRRNVDNFFQSIAAKPAKMMTGEDWPNMAVIAAYRAAGRDQEAETLTAARDTYNARREADKEAWSKKYAAQQTYYNSPKPKNFDDMTELEKAQYMMETAQECAKQHPELEWADILEKAAKRLKKAEMENTREDIKEGTAVWTTIELNPEYGKQGRVVRKFFADHNVWCLDIEFEDGTRHTYAEEYVTTEKPWAVVGAKCKHKYLDSDVVLTITAVGQYYGIKAESEDGKVKRCGLVRDFEPVEDGKAEKAASGIKDDSFFIKGKKYRCIKSVVMKKGGKTAFKAGSIYEQTDAPTHWVGWLRNEQGDRHGWPQPVYIPQEVKTWGTKPEDIDPRNYFEPLQEPREIREKLTIKFHSDKYHMDFAGVVHIDDIEINEPHNWHAHDFTLNDLNYSASIWGDLDYFEKPTTGNLSVQVEMYGNGTHDIIRNIEIVACK